jgi:hypothetical protein
MYLLGRYILMILKECFVAKINLNLFLLIYVQKLKSISTLFGIKMLFHSK